MASVRRLADGRWQAQYRATPNGKVHTKTTHRKIDAQQWLDAETAKLVTGSWVEPRTARTTVAAWCETWLAGYATRRDSTVREARTHVARITAEFGDRRLSDVRPSDVKAWCAKLRAGGYEASYVYALHSRLSQILGDAVHDGVLARNPCSRRTSPGQGKQRPYVATVAQVWALHDAMPERNRTAILLGAYVGLRVAEACGLRVVDVDFTRGIVSPAVQYPADPLKTETSRTPVPIPNDLALMLARQVEQWPAEWLLTNTEGGQLSPWVLQRALGRARRDLATLDANRDPGERVGLPAGFRYHDLRHHYASVLLASGASIKVVQARLRHASAKTTLDTYAHLMPDSDDLTRTAIEAALSTRPAAAVESLSNGSGVSTLRRRSEAQTDQRS